MDLGFKFEGFLSNHESVLEEVIMLKKELCNQIITFIRNTTGSIQGQTNV